MAALKLITSVSRALPKSTGDAWPASTAALQGAKALAAPAAVSPSKTTGDAWPASLIMKYLSGKLF
eukprot:5185001-Karenia_brevis.AAC.1